MTTAAPENPQAASEKTAPKPSAVAKVATSEPIVLWNAKEARTAAERFARDYASLRTSLYQHYVHKGHVALKFPDNFAGFVDYCREKLKLESDASTIKLQIAAAEVSENVGATVPMVIGRHIAKLPVEQQKAVYEEVVTARQGYGATQRSANEMEDDVRRVVRQRMGVEDKPKEPSAPVSTTNTTPAPPQVPPPPVKAAQEAVQEPRTASAAVSEGKYPPEGETEVRKALSTALAILRDWASAFDNNDEEAGKAAHAKTAEFLKRFKA